MTKLKECMTEYYMQAPYENEFRDAWVEDRNKIIAAILEDDSELLTSEFTTWEKEVVPDFISALTGDGSFAYAGDRLMYLAIPSLKKTAESEWDDLLETVVSELMEEHQSEMKQQQGERYE